MSAAVTERHGNAALKEDAKVVILRPQFVSLLRRFPVHHPAHIVVYWVSPFIFV